MEKLGEYLLRFFMVLVTIVLLIIPPFFPQYVVLTGLILMNFVVFLGLGMFLFSCSERSAMTSIYRAFRGTVKITRKK